MLCSASCKCSVYVQWVCEWMWMYVYGSGARHCQFYLDSQRNLLPNESQGVYFSVLFVIVVFRLTCCSVFESDAMYTLIFCLHKAFNVFLRPSDVHRFYSLLTSSGGIQRAPVSKMDRQITCHQCTAFSHTDDWSMLLFSVWGISEQDCSWVYCLPVCFCQSVWAVQPPACFHWHAWLLQVTDQKTGTYIIVYYNFPLQ